MGNCSNCKFCTDLENDSINSSIKISTNSILGGHSQTTPTNSICCCKAKPLNNPILLDNIKLSAKEKRIFELKISKNKSKINAKRKNINGEYFQGYDKTSSQKTEKLETSDISLSISNRIFINEIEQTPETKYKIIKNIGNGSYGSVFLAYNIFTKEKVAIKKIYKSSEILLSDGIIIDEIEILKNLNHPDIVKIIEFYGTKEAYYIINEYCSGGELFDKAVNYLSETQI